jgi:hypothetical protein
MGGGFVPAWGAGQQNMGRPSWTTGVGSTAERFRALGSLGRRFATEVVKVLRLMPAEKGFVEAWGRRCGGAFRRQELRLTPLERLGRGDAGGEGLGLCARRREDDLFL